MRIDYPLAGLAIVAAMLATTGPAAAQRGAVRGTIKAMPLRAAAASEVARGQAVRPGVPLRITKALPDGRPVNLSISINALPSPNLRIVGASYLSGERMLIVNIENKGTVTSEEATLLGKVLWGADVDKDKLLNNAVGGKTQDEILKSVIDDAFEKMALAINVYTAAVKPLAPGSNAIVSIELPDVTEEVAFCGFKGKKAATDCVDPATQSVFCVTLVPGKASMFSGLGK
ncbi:hypothetical protein RZN05_01970 [Sphingomonas sp. HF-S4]|uniref:Uncharacterized protein n=1 Tax=Sphingomonas agrestis TaxID=3080540 RepID=A0ABU3Y2Z6_9SPHN|nr:hypothetical protein [Sphingomonas sp. HF-S4]MDV3455735.1 hypothetical protein [Sphingomonas sp. HF-S4]